MIPIRDLNPTRTFPVVTILLIAANVIVFLFLEPISGSDLEQARYFACTASIPYEVTHGETLLEARQERGFLGGPADAFASFQEASCPSKGIWLSILSSMFLHGGLLHIAGNMLFLWVFGNNVEDRLGPLRYPIFYFGAGLAATFAQAYVSPSSAVPLIGASGAVAGVLGAYLLLFPRARVVTLVIFFFISVVEMPAVAVLGLWFVLQLFQSAGSVTGDAGGVAYMAHVAGFVAGMLLLVVLRGTRPPDAERPSPS